MRWDGTRTSRSPQGAKAGARPLKQFDGELPEEVCALSQILASPEASMMDLVCPESGSLDPVSLETV